MAEVLVQGRGGCSHYAKLCLFCKKISQHEAIFSANDFFHQRKFLQNPPNFKDTVNKLWRPLTFCQVRKSFVP